MTAAAPATAAPAPVAQPVQARPDPAALLEQAKAYHRRGRFEQAGDLYARALAARPRDVGALANYALVLAKLGSRKRALEMLRRALGLDPRNADLHARLGNVLLTEGCLDEAQRSARRAAELDRANGTAHRILATCHLRSHRLDQATAAGERALSIDPADEKTDVLMGVVERRRGDLEAARSRLSRIAEASSDPEVAGRALKELGHVLDRLGEYDAAFETFTRAGEVLARTPTATRIDRDTFIDMVAEYRAGITREVLSSAAAAPDDGLPTPAFLVGFPRSGTTMTEQVLAAHPSVVTTDEAPLIPAVKEELVWTVGEADLATMIGRLDAPTIGKLRALYWKRAAEELGVEARDLGGKVFIDKLPLNLVNLGLLNVLFPAARVIVALRDPRDVCLSCFMQPFKLNRSLVNFLQWERTGELYARVMDLWLHLRGLITLEATAVRYEDTVRDLETASRRILGLLDLEWHERVARFHELARSRAISTPSYAAVVQPVHSRAVGRWRNYAAPIARIAPKLDPFVAAFGYGA